MVSYMGRRQALSSFPALAQHIHVTSDRAGGGRTTLRGGVGLSPTSGGTTQNATQPVWYKHRWSEEGLTAAQTLVHLGRTAFYKAGT